MIQLTLEDIESHKIVAEQLDDYSLSSVLSSIKAEYEQMKGKIEFHEESSYLKLIDIYGNELAARYEVLNPEVTKNQH